MKMKRIFCFILLFFFIALSHTNVLGQYRIEDMNVYNAYIGKSRSEIVKIQPNYEVVTKGDIGIGNYYIDRYVCEDNGKVGLFVGFDGLYHKDTVESVTLYIEGCKELIPTGDLSDAASVCLLIYGLIDEIDNGELLQYNEQMTTIMFSRKQALFSAFKKYSNKWGYGFLCSCSHVNLSK